MVGKGGSLTVERKLGTPYIHNPRTPDSALQSLVESETSLTEQAYEYGDTGEPWL